VIFISIKKKNEITPAVGVLAARRRGVFFNAHPPV